MLLLDNQTVFTYTHSDFVFSSVGYYVRGYLSMYVQLPSLRASCNYYFIAQDGNVTFTDCKPQLNWKNKSLTRRNSPKTITEFLVHISTLAELNCEPVAAVRTRITMRASWNNKNYNNYENALMSSQLNPVDPVQWTIIIDGRPRVRFRNNCTDATNDQRVNERYNYSIDK